MPLTDKQRQDVLAELKTWIGTPYRGWSCIKGAGVDCGQLIYGVFRGCGLVGELSLPKDYSLQVAQHRASTEYVDIVASFFREIQEEEAKPGDLVVYKLGLAYAHAAFIVDWPNNVIQAEFRHGVSGTHGTQSPIFKNAERRFFTLKDEYCEVSSVNTL
jgi:cell wall-associated NlpC family hydrolase